MLKVIANYLQFDGQHLRAASNDDLQLNLTLNSRIKPSSDGLDVDSKKPLWVAGNTFDFVRADDVGGHTEHFRLLDGGDPSVSPMLYTPANATDPTVNGHLNWQMDGEYSAMHMYSSIMAPYYWSANQLAPIVVWLLNTNDERVEYNSVMGKTIVEYAMSPASSAWVQR